MPRRKKDFKNIIIAVLSLSLAVETFFILHQKTRESKGTAAPPAVTVKKAAKKPLVGRIALIIDDCGYSSEPCDFLNHMTRPITFSILPELDYSAEVARCARDKGKDVMLHLPMEPYSYSEKYPENYIIKTSMTKTSIENTILKALENVPFAVGVNNHMGSKATENKRVMRTVFSALQKHNLFFVDSLVTSRSICKTLAKEMHLPFAERDIFLDNKNERAYIEGQLQKAVQKARSAGRAVAIGHARNLTLQVIAEQIPTLEKQGIQFVFIKDLTKTP